MKKINKCFFTGHGNTYYDHEKLAWTCRKCGESEYKYKTLPQIWNNFWREYGWVIYLLVLLISFVLLLLGLFYLLDNRSCRITANKMEVEYYYNFWSGCMININDAWIKLSQYIVVGK